MLSSPDADLVRRAPALPGLGTVLAPARFVAALRAARPELEIEAVQVGYVHYKPGRECIVGYRLPRSERAPEPSEPVTLRGTLDLYAVAQRRERWERKHPAAGHAPGDGHRRVSLADEAVTVALFPDDLTLGTLGHLFEADARTRLLRDLLPGRPDLPARPVGAPAYKPPRPDVRRLPRPPGGWPAGPGARGGGAAVVRPGGGACAHISTAGRTGRASRAPARHPPPRRPYGRASDPRRLLCQAGPVGRRPGGHHRPRPGGARRSRVRSGAVHRSRRACRCAGRSPGSARRGPHPSLPRRLPGRHGSARSRPRRPLRRDRAPPHAPRPVPL